MDTEVFETKEIEIDWKGTKEVVKIRELSLGERTALNEKYVTTKMRGTSMEVDVNLFALKQEALATAIVSAPFGIGLKNVQNIPGGIATKLIEETEEFLTTGVEKKESGVEQSEEGQSEQEQTS